ncbi:unnamed protein product [Thelazia callipaeda]|uniref:XPGI domain-containing protein n=1 Tax=Thelazia callipaeda TaxID=103827 RepID=A0A0N5DBW0_THECL|nr:unnamed protein product [Thelazia callipaeda]
MIGNVYKSDSDDDDDALQEAIYASLLENKYEKQLFFDGYGCESKGDMIERLRAVFASRARDLQCDTWSSSSESSDEFIEVPSEIPKDSSMSTDNRSYFKGTHVYKPGQFQEKKSVNELVKILLILCITYLTCISFPDLLRFCGIPFIVAPGEAEAQCCELERLGLVQGIISDDSDVWLFGASVVYKNMFNQKRQLQMYSIKTIQKDLGLSRWEAIQVALLSGSDYTNGLEGVGVVSALELVSEFATVSHDAEPWQEVFCDSDILLSFLWFQAFYNLERISRWLNSKIVNSMQSSSGGKFFGDTIEETFVENKRRWKLKRLIEKNNDLETIKAFPSHEIFNAYARPLVDSSTEKPKWRRIDMEKLQLFVWEKLGWDKAVLEKQTNQSLTKWNEYLNPDAGGSGQSYQMHMTSFTHQLQKSEADQRLALTLRVRTALERLAIIKS